MNELLPSTKKGYLALLEAEIVDPPLDHPSGSEGSVILKFEHTDDAQIKGMASLPIELVYPEWPVEVFLRFNEDYPEAIQHIKGVRAFAKAQEVLYG